MSNQDALQDPLKPLSDIFEPNNRQEFRLSTLEDNHEALSGIVLNESVPLDVRQLFETAKNLSLYSWFVYRFHQVSELISFVALEMALRERFMAENPPQENSKQRPLSLHRLLQHAKASQWIANERFPSLYERARVLADHQKLLKMAHEHDFEKEPSMLIEESSEADIATAMADIDMVSAIADNAHKIRNNLAHGSPTLHPGSIYTLRTNAEVINQIYPSQI